jgi:hypothetical protein
MPGMSTIDASLVEPLWTRTRAMYARAVAAIGDAAAIALLASLPRIVRRQMVAWLYPLECIVRRLLIAEAAELHRAERSREAHSVRIEHIPLRGMAQHWQGRIRTTWTAGLQTRTGAAVAEKCASEDARSKIYSGRPETWSAHFSFALPRNPRLVPNARAPRILDPFGDYPQPPPPAPCVIRPEQLPFRLARRFEALRRVLENPRPYAERLARVLAREVRSYSAIVRRAVLAGPRTDDFDPNDSRLSLEALGAAFNAPDAFKDTS